MQERGVLVPGRRSPRLPSPCRRVQETLDAVGLTGLLEQLAPAGAIRDVSGPWPAAAAAAGPRTVLPEVAASAQPSAAGTGPVQSQLRARQAASPRQQQPVAMRALASDAGAMSDSHGVAAATWGRGHASGASGPGGDRAMAVAELPHAGEGDQGGPVPIPPTQAPVASPAAAAGSTPPPPPAVAVNLTGLWARDQSRSDAEGYERALVGVGRLAQAGGMRHGHALTC